MSNDLQFTDPVKELEFVIDTNLEIRHLTTFQRCQLGYNIREIYEEYAKQRILDGKKAAPKSEFTGAAY